MPEMFARFNLTHYLRVREARIEAKLPVSDRKWMPKLLADLSVEIVAEDKIHAECMRYNYRRPELLYRQPNGRVHFHYPALGNLISLWERAPGHDDDVDQRCLDAWGFEACVAQEVRA